MRRKDYYVILGTSRTDAPAAIRSAYRDLAHRYHPDRSGPEGTKHFQEINEAYEVLSDPEQRAAYDREGARHSVQVNVEPMGEGLHRPPNPSGHAEHGTANPAPKGPAPEPMIPDDSSVLRAFGVTRPSDGAQYERTMRNFARHGWPKSGRVEPLTVELHVSPDRARRGGVVTLALPAFRPCPACKGTGSTWELYCLHCNGTGMQEAEQPVRISLPPNTRDRDLFQLPVRHHGIQNLVLNLLVRVDRL